MFYQIVHWPIDFVGKMLMVRLQHWNLHATHSLSIQNKFIGRQNSVNDFRIPYKFVQFANEIFDKLIQMLKYRSMENLWKIVLKFVTIKSIKWNNRKYKLNNLML